jgi:hypothetical protein
MQEIIKVLQDTTSNIHRTLELLSAQNNHLQLLTNLLEYQSINPKSEVDPVAATLSNEQLQLVYDVATYNEGISNFLSVAATSINHRRKVESVPDGFSNGRSEIESVPATIENKVHQPPLAIDITKIKQYILWEKVKVQLPAKRSKKTIKNVSIILKALFLNNKQSHHDLMKLTGMTVDGMAKHIQMLKKNNFIHRVSFQQYHLTEKSLNILRAAMNQF